MNGAAAAPTLGPCPHCGQPHAEDVLVCPKESKILPLEGRILDSKFRFTKLLGAGGMGAVWKAQNIRVRKSVAIKLMHPEFAGNPGILDRFRNEATAAGQIGSQHICDIYDFGASVLGPYIVLEMLNGNSFGEVIQKYGRVDPGLAAIVMRQALEGLEAAHRVGIIHRDLKPENIFLHEPTPGRLLVKLMDFGISKFSQGGNDGKTGVGVLMGTPEYMSPEQAEGAAGVDQRTDIWAMGAILYKALTGVEAFAGATMAATLVALATKEPKPIETLAPHVPPELVAVVRRCLNKEPEARFQSAREMSDALAPFEQLAGALPPPSAPQTMAGGGFQTTSPQSNTAAPASPGATVITGGGPPPGFQPQPPQASTFIGNPAQQQQPQAATFVGNIAPPQGNDDSWSLGQNLPTDSRPPSTLTANTPASSSKAPLVILLVLLLVAIGGTGYFLMAGKPKSTGEPGTTDTKIAATGPETPATAGATAGDTKPGDTKSGDTKPGDTAGAVTPPPGDTKPGDTAGTVTPPPGDTKPGETAGTVTPPPGDTAGDTAGDTGDEKHDAKLPPPKPDLKLVVQSGSLFTPKVASENTKSLAEAVAHCTSLKRKNFGKLEHWRLATSGEVLKFRDNKDVDKLTYWTSDKEMAGKAKRVNMLRGSVMETDPNNSANTRPFCVTKR
jgi:serine/threonine-protein kinase